MFSRLFGKRKHSAKARSSRLAVEVLEDRVTPSIYGVIGNTLTIKTSELTGGGNVMLAPGPADTHTIAITYSSAADPTPTTEFAAPSGVAGANFLATIVTDGLPTSGPVTINFADPFRDNPVPGTAGDPVGATGEPLFPNLHGNPPLTPPGPGIPVQGDLQVRGTAGTFTINVTANTAIAQIADYAGNDAVNITANTSQLSIVDNAPQPETINLCDSSHGIDGLQGFVYLGSQFSFPNATNELSVNIDAAASASSGTWNIGQAGLVQPGDELLGLQYVPAGTNIASLTVAVNAVLFNPFQQFGPSMGPSLSDAGPQAITLNLKTGSTLKQNPEPIRFPLGTAVTAHGNGSTLESAGGETWLLTGQNSGTWPVPQVTGPDTQTFVWDGMTTLVGGGNDTLDYTALLLANPNLDYHVDLVHGQATDVTNGISRFDAVIPDRLVVDPPPTQGSVFGQAIANLTIDIHATVAPLVPQVTGLPPGLNWAFDSSTQQITISGTPTLAGTYQVAVSVFDQSMPVPEGRQVTFEWDVDHAYHIVADPEDLNQTVPINQPYGQFKIQVVDENGKYEDRNGVTLPAGVFGVTFEAGVTDSASAYFVQTTGGGGGLGGGLGSMSAPPPLGGGGPVTSQVPTFATSTDANGYAEIGVDDASTLTANGFVGPFTLEVQAVGALSTLPIAPVDFTLTNVAANVATMTDFAASASPAISGQFVTYTAQVVREDGAVATGSIQFTFTAPNGQVQSALVPLSAGQASTKIGLFTSAAASTTYDVAATYLPDTSNVDGSFDGLSEEVDPWSVQSIPSAIGQAAQTGAPIIVLAPASQLPSDALILSSLTGLTQPTTFTLTLTGGTSGPVSFNLPLNMFLAIVGAPGTTNTIVSGATGPAMTVRGGNVSLHNLTLVGVNNGPTLSAEGGSAMVRGVTVAATKAGADDVHVGPGGTVNLGTAQDPGQNVFAAQQNGAFVNNQSGQIVSAVGNTYVLDREQVAARVVHNNYVIAKHMRGTVMWVANQFYLSLKQASRAALQILIDTVPAGSTVNVQRLVPHYKVSAKPGVKVAFGTPGRFVPAGAQKVGFVKSPHGPLVAGTPVNLTLDFRPTSGVGPAPTGTALIFIDGTYAAEASLEEDGSATFDGLIFSAGRHTITIVYLGDVDYAVASLDETFNVLR